MYSCTRIVCRLSFDFICIRMRFEMDKMTIYHLPKMNKKKLSGVLIVKHQ